MPVVAGNLPYSGVPGAEPNVGQPDRYQRIQATPDAFGVGPAIIGLGQQIGKAADEWADEAIKQQRFVNKQIADEQTNSWQEATNKILYGDPDTGETGLLGKHGGDFMRDYPAALKQIDTLTKGIQGKLTPAQKQIFDGEVRWHKSSIMNSLGAHMAKATTDYAVGNAEAKSKLGGIGIAQASTAGDLDAFNKHLQQTMEGQIDASKALGESQAQLDVRLQKARGDGVKQWVQNRALTDPMGAKAFLDANQDALLPGEYPTLVHGLQTHIDNTVAANAVDYAFGRADAPKQPGGGPARGGARALAPSAIGPHAQEAVSVFKQAGWSDAAIEGALHNGLAEGGFGTTWKPGDGGTSFGHWQYHRGGELEGFQRFAGGDRSTAAQAKYLVQRMEEIRPGFGRISDPRQATNIIEAEFERPRDVTGSRYRGPILAASGSDQDTVQQERGAQAQPIPTGLAQAGTATPTAGGAQPGLINRSGQPALEDLLARLNTLNLTAEQRFKAEAKIRSEYTAIEADYARSDRIKKEQEEKVVQDRENEIWKDVYSPNPKITATEIANDPTFNSKPELRKQMIELINNPPGSGVPAPQSYAAALSLIDRIRLPEGDPNKITSDEQLYPYMRQLNRTDFDYVRKALGDVRGPGGEVLAKTEERFFKSVEKYITKSNPLHGEGDPTGDARLYEYHQWVDSKKDEYKKAGKNPADLFNPQSPDYVGKPEILQYYQPTMQQSQQSMQGFAKGAVPPLPPLVPWGPPPIPSLLGPLPAPGQPVVMAPRGNAPVAEAPIPPASAVIPGQPARKPGETAQQYLERIGKP